MQTQWAAPSGTFYNDAMTGLTNAWESPTAFPICDNEVVFYPTCNDDYDDNRNADKEEDELTGYKAEGLLDHHDHRKHHNYLSRRVQSFRQKHKKPHMNRRIM